jgi:hypothetical protein
MFQNLKIFKKYSVIQLFRCTHFMDKVYLNNEGYIIKHFWMLGKEELKIIRKILVAQEELVADVYGS